MRRAPTSEDQARWNPILEKVRHARRSLEEAYYLVGQAIPDLDGDDQVSLEVVKRLSATIESARMAVGNIEHPVRSDWAGSDSRGDYVACLSWRDGGLGA